MSKLQRKQEVESRPRMLVVEDDDDYRSALIRTISKLNRDRGWEILALSNIRDAEMAVSHATVDVVVTDYHLPDGLGTSLTRRTPSRNGKAQRILLSGDTEGVQRAWRDEPDIADDIWDKAWELQAISDRLDATMARVEFCRYWT